MRTRIKKPIVSSNDTKKELSECFLSYALPRYKVKMFDTWKRCNLDSAIAFNKAGFEVIKY